MIAIALTVFVVGWVFGVVAMQTIVPGTVAMRWQTAVGLMSAAAALLLLLDAGPDVRRLRCRRRAGTAGAAATLTLGLAVASEYVFGWRLGIDELLWQDTVARDLGFAYPGRPAPTTALCFVLAGLALLTLDRPPVRTWRPAEVLILPVALLGMLTVIGYLYEIPGLYGPSSAAKMALGTGVCFFALAAAVLLARPRGRLVTLAMTDDPGGVLMRHLLPVAVVLPLLLGFARLQAGKAGLFGDRVGTWWLTVATIGIFSLLICRVASRLSHYAARGRALEAELQLLANHDALTGLFNRHRFDQDLVHDVARARRYGDPLSVVVIDLDGLKVANDTLGHAAGDALLQGVAETLRARLRDADVAGRLGGDEFALLLPATGADGAQRVAEAMRAAVSQVRIPTAGGVVVTKASVGVATLAPTDHDGERLMARADDAMYRAKRAGGDQVAVARDATPLGPSHA